MRKQNQTQQSDMSQNQKTGARKGLRLHRETLRALTSEELRAAGGMTGAQCGLNPTWGCVKSQGASCV